MNKFAVALLSLGLLGALPAAHAAPVSVDAGTFVFSYDDSFMAGATFSYDAGVFRFSGLDYVAKAYGGSVDTEAALSMGSFNSYEGRPFPISIVAKAGYQVTGLTETVLGSYSLQAGQGEDSVAGASIGLVSRWLYADGVVPLGQNTPFNISPVLSNGQGPVSGAFQASGALDFSSVIASEHLTPGTVVLSSLDVLAGTGAHNEGSSAIASMSQYQIGVVVSPVPEPESLGMLIAGLGLVGVMAGRRNNKR